MKSVYVFFYEKPKKLSLLVLSDDRQETENIEIKDVDRVEFKRFKDYPKIILSETEG